jgi:hypothetical protein
MDAESYLDGRRRMRFSVQDDALVCRRQGETLCIEAWGPDALRVRATRYAHFSGNDWGLTIPPMPTDSHIACGTAPVAQGPDEA